VAVLLMSSLAEAQDAPRGERKLAVAARVGGMYNALSKPTDPKGEPTLLYGTAFTGGGFVVGAGLVYGLGSGSAGDLSLTFDALYATMSGMGYAQTADNTKRQELTLGLHMLRLPLMLRLSSTPDGDESLVLNLGLGAEVLFGLASSASLVSRGVDPAPPPLHTVPTTHVGVAAAFGASWRTPTWSIPVEVRLTWDPMVEGSTRSRFDSFQSAEQPGNYQVAFDWQVLFMAGLGYNL
jgi:hypothetical protein